MFRNYCLVVSVLAIAYGVGYMVMPSVIASLYFESPDSQVPAMARYFGLTMLGNGVMLWLLKDVADIAVRNAVVTGFLVSGVVGLVTSVVLVLNGTMQVFGWSAAIIYLMIAVWSLLVRKSVTTA